MAEHQLKRAELEAGGRGFAGLLALRIGANVEISANIGHIY